MGRRDLYFPATLLAAILHCSEQQMLSSPQSKKLTKLYSIELLH